MKGEFDKVVTWRPLTDYIVAMELLSLPLLQKQVTENLSLAISHTAVTVENVVNGRFCLPYF